jgi:uncharacterized protein (DUF362 family)
LGKSRVSIVRADPHDGFPAVKDAVRTALDLIGGVRDLIRPGCLVLIKPSWVAPPVEREAGCITDPHIPRAIADLVKELGARAVIAESSAVGVDTDKVLQASGYRELAEMGYEIVNLKKTPWVETPCPEGRVFDRVPVWELTQKADVIISVPKLKTHDQTEMTCAIKNLKGLLTDSGKRAMHQEGLFEGVIDLMSALKPCLTVVDATICQEGLGPIFGRPVHMGVILAGRDLVAVDATCARLIGLDPRETLLTVNAAARALGVMDSEHIEVCGVPLEAVRRRFMRAHEDRPVVVDGFDLVIGEATCTGCRNTVLSALVDMKNADQLEYLPGVAVVVGGAPDCQALGDKTIVTVGKCVPVSSRTSRHVTGCPPNNALIVKAIVGDRAAVKRMYASEDLSQSDR